MSTLRIITKLVRKLLQSQVEFYASHENDKNINIRIISQAKRDAYTHAYQIVEKVEHGVTMSLERKKERRKRYVETSQDLIAAKNHILFLVNAMEEWGRDEDGIHPDAWDAYEDARTFLHPKKEVTDEHS